jgi:hypothetical protein
VRPPGFSSCRRHGYIPAERIHVRIPGHTGRIPGTYLCDKSRHSSFVAITQLENRSQILTENIRVSTTIKLAPDGSNTCPISNASSMNIVGCALSAPDGSSPRGYSRKKNFLSIGSRDNNACHTSTRNTSPAKFFNSRYLQEHLFVEYQLSSSNVEFHSILCERNSPRGCAQKIFLI